MKNTKKREGTTQTNKRLFHQFFITINCLPHLELNQGLLRGPYLLSKSSLFLVLVFIFFRFRVVFWLRAVYIAGLQSALQRSLNTPYRVES